MTFSTTSFLSKYSININKAMAIWAPYFLAVFLFSTTEAATNCQFFVTNPKEDIEVYDFSSLATNTPWEVSDASDSKSKGGVLFLSMCGFLKGLSKSQCPDPTASACLARRENEKWKTVISNAGNNQSRLWYDGRHLTFSLKGDQVCKDGRNYSTNIHFTCNPQTIGEPWFIGLSQECAVELGWHTSAACPVTPDHDICLLPVPGGRPLDLTPLASPTYYRVRDPSSGRVFQLNLCAEIREGVCDQGATSCVVNSTATIGKLADGSELAHIPGGLKLKYLAAAGSSTEVIFNCNITAPIKPEPIFVSQNENSYVFRVDTPFACPAAPIDCVAYDNEGTKYDLNSLRRSQGLWSVRDNRPGKSHLLYHINVCGPLPSGVTPTCLAGNIGACMTNTKPNSPSFSLGLVENPPRVTKDGSLLLEYRGGAPCKQSKFRRRVSISLECSTEEHGPVLDAVLQEDCSYAFLWRTPAACAAQPAQGDNCRVNDPRLSYAFDVRTLYNNQADHQVQGDNNDSFLVNLCGSLHLPCNGHDNISVCLKRDGKEIAIGYRDDRLKYQDGRLSFTLTGDQCQPGINSSVTIILGCEHSDPQAPLPTPQVFPSGQNDCRFFMVWNHPTACPPYHEISCSVRDDDGQLYDLSDLAWRSANHEARSRDGHRSGLQLNVCRSVVFGRDSACDPSSGACLHVGGKFVNIGDVKDGPYLEKGILKLKYEQGALCTLPEGPDHMTTLINFVCNHDSVDAEPEYLGEHLCEHQVLWVTSAACPRNYESEPVTNTCSTSNPITKYRFDLSSLKNVDYSAEDDSGNKYDLSICSPLTTTKCAAGSGSCQEVNGVARNSGIANGDLQFRPGGSLFLNYSGGEPCGSGGQRGTLIEFMCGAEGSIEGPRVIDFLGGCLTVVHWHTELVCEKRIRCVINNLDLEVDLSPLIRVTQNYRTSAPDGREFFINVCRPVLSVPGLSCPAGSGACVARRKDKTYQEELSLGFPLLHPVATASQESSLMYAFGSPCPGSPGINISSIIRFQCNVTAGPGGPVFVSETHDCQYQFDWATSLVCSEAEEKASQCSVYSQQLRREISLESLQKKGGYQTKSKENRRYSVNLCGDPGACRGAPVCQDSDKGWASHGTLQRALYDYQSDYLKLQYSGGSPCVRNETYGAEVWLRCDSTAGTGTPRVVTDYACYVIFEWRTSAVCGGKQRPSISPTPSTAPVPSIAPTPGIAAGAAANDTEGGASAGTIVAAILGVIVTLALVVLAALYVRRGNVCMPSWRLSRWLHSPSHSQVHYSRVASADEASHLLRSQPELEWDSDEELLKV